MNKVNYSSKSAAALLQGLDQGILLLDGAMGTVLMAVGLEQGDPPEEWNVRHPHRIRTVHDAYINAHLSKGNC